MVHWSILVIAIFVSAGFGFLLASLLHANVAEDRGVEQKMREMLNKDQK